MIKAAAHVSLASKRASSSLRCPSPAVASTSLLKPFSTTPPRTADAAASPAQHKAAAKPASSKSVKSRASDVLQTIPFVLGPDQAKETLELAAHSVFGLRHAFQLIVARFLKNYFNYSLPTEVKLLAFKPLLIPSWKLDVRLKGSAVLDGVRMNWRISAPNATTPAIDLTPLNELSLTAPWAVEAEPYVAQKHRKQHGMEIDALPFTRSPLELVKELVKLPRTSSNNAGIDIDPRQIKPVLFAAYPLYIPVYLGEFVETSGEERRVTCVAHATTDNTAFSTYLPYLDPPVWAPPSGGDELTIAGNAEDPNKDLPRDSLKKFRPVLDAFVSVSQQYLAVSRPIKDLAKMWEDPTVMAYNPNASLNKIYMEAEENLSDARGRLQTLIAKTSDAPGDARALVVTNRSIQFAPTKELRDLLKAEVDKAQKLADEARPRWLEEQEASTPPK